MVKRRIRGDTLEQYTRPAAIGATNGVARATIPVPDQREQPLVQSPRYPDSTVRPSWGDIACWRVLLEHGAEPERWFVDKQNGDAVLVLLPATADRPRSKLNLFSRTGPRDDTLSRTRGDFCFDRGRLCAVRAGERSPRAHLLPDA